MSDEQQAAQELTKYLLNRERYGGKSPLEERVQVEISAMAREIAADIVAENPQLREVIGRRVRDVVAQVLRDDAWLGDTVVQAVAKALHKFVSED